MIPGPTYLYHCPGCSNVIANGSIVSGNTFGSALYTDARQIAPMLPEFPVITKCQSCNTILWLDKMEPFASVNDPRDEACSNAQPAEFLTMEDYFRALTMVVTNDSDERYLRTRIWWKYNDRVRKDDNMFHSVPDWDRWRENSNKLLNLLDPNDVVQRLNMAELHRNLGQFDECLQLLKGVKDDYEWFAGKIREECQARRTAVARFEY